MFATLNWRFNAKDNNDANYSSFVKQTFAPSIHDSDFRSDFSQLVSNNKEDKLVCDVLMRVVQSRQFYSRNIDQSSGRISGEIIALTVKFCSHNEFYGFRSIPFFKNVVSEFNQLSMKSKDFNEQCHVSFFKTNICLNDLDSAD